MSTRWIRYGLLGLLGAGALAPMAKLADRPAWAEEIRIKPQEKAMLRRAAQISAYRALAEKIYGLQVTADTTVADLARENDNVGTSVEAMLRGVRLAEPRYYSDGTAEVDGEVTIEQVVTTLRHSFDSVNDNGKHRKEQIDEIAKRTERSVISATGYASIHNPPIPTDASLLPPLHTVNGPPENINLPPIWVQAGGEERLKARRMAELDAYRHLSERLNGVMLSGASTGQNFLLTNDTVKAATKSLVRGARITEIHYGNDGLCTVTMQVTLQQMVEHIQHALDQVDKNGFQRERTELQTIERHVERKVLSENGVGALNVDAKQTPDASKSGASAP